MRQSPTSPYTPDLEQLRTWLEKMVAALRFVELILGVVNLIARLRDINLELTKRVAYLTRKRPRSETLERPERQLVLPFAIVSSAAGMPKAADQAARQPKVRRRSPRAR